MRLIDADTLPISFDGHTVSVWKKDLDAAPTVNPYEWISVEDRLPEVLVTEKGWGNHRVQKSIRVLCACKQKSGKVLVKEGYYELWDYTDKPYWRIPGNIDSVTHWMPLPTPPTEKEN
jgi:hypothetical protein